MTQAALVAAAMAVGNVLAYVLSVSASRRLGPEQFGALGAMLGLLVMGYVVALGLQMVTARRLASAPDAFDAPATARTAVAASVLLGAGAAVLALPVARFLHLDGPVPVLLLAVTFVPLTWSGHVQGLALGREQFGLVSATFLLSSVGKVGGGLVGLALSPTVTAVMAGTAVGTVVGVLAATWVARSLVGRPRRTPGSDAGRELGHVVHALLALYVLTNMDVLLARHHLSPRQAGLYAAGAIVAKIAFWLPQFVTVVAIPRLSDTRRRHGALRASVAATSLVGVTVTGATWLAGGLVVALVAGSAYADLGGYVWAFAAAGSAFALAQLLLYARLAREDRTAVIAVWTAVLLLAALVATVAHSTPQQIVAATASVALLLAATGLLAQRNVHDAQGGVAPGADVSEGLRS